MKGSYVKCFGTDLSAHRKLERQKQAMNISSTVIYKDGFAYSVPKEQHYLNGKVKTRIYNLIKENTIEASLKLYQLGVVINRVRVGEAV